jgi:hypothetical protein
MSYFSITVYRNNPSIFAEMQGLRLPEMNKRSENAQSDNLEALRISARGMPRPCAPKSKEQARLWQRLKDQSIESR